MVDPQQKPLEGVEVRLAGDSTRRFTSAAGTFRLDAPRGKLLLQVRRPGYNAQLLRLTGEWSGTILMVPGAFVLPEIQVTSRYAKPAEYAYTTKYDDYFRRRRQGLGQFIDRDDIERRHPFRTSDILEGQAGIKVSYSSDRNQTFVGFVRCNEYPPKINVYVDGNKMIPPGGAMLAAAESPARRINRDPEIAGITGEMLSRINPREIEFIEIFRGPGELPAEFNDGNCGAIVIWTRQGGD